MKDRFSVKNDAIALVDMTFQDCQVLSNATKVSSTIIDAAQNEDVNSSGYCLEIIINAAKPAEKANSSPEYNK